MFQKRFRISSLRGEIVAASVWQKSRNRERGSFACWVPGAGEPSREGQERGRRLQKWKPRGNAMSIEGTCQTRARRQYAAPARARSRRSRASFFFSSLRSPFSLFGSPGVTVLCGADGLCAGQQTMAMQNVKCVVVGDGAGISKKKEKSQAGASGLAARCAVRRSAPEPAARTREAARRSGEWRAAFF